MELVSQLNSAIVEITSITRLGMVNKRATSCRPFLFNSVYSYYICNMFAIVDLETTGGNARNGKIIEIAIVVHNGKRIIEEYSTLVNPEEEINPFVTSLTGITDSMVSDAPRFDQIADEIIELTKGRVFIAHNARFDYGFLRQEFKRLGVRFQRQNLCTVKLSKKLLPGHASYSLGKLCQDLDIPVKNRHRALGDAVATALLMEKLLFNDKNRLIEDMLKDELAHSNLPASIQAEQVRELPEEIGVYYFLDDNGKKLYIGKSKNIRLRVISHFSSDLTSQRFAELKDKIAGIAYEITGSEMVAEIREAGEIKRFMPPYNKAQRRKHYRYGVHLNENQDGYKSLEVAILSPERDPLLKFTSKRWAERAVKDIYTKNKIEPERRNHLSTEEYNSKLLDVASRYQFFAPNFFIIDEGRTFDERSVIQVEGGRYVGFGFFQNEFVEGGVEELKHFVKNDYDSPDKRQIIRKYLNKANKYKFVEY